MINVIRIIFCSFFCRIDNLRGDKPNIFKFRGVRKTFGFPCVEGDKAQDGREGSLKPKNPDHY